MCKNGDYRRGSNRLIHVSKKGQLTLFVILALVIVVVIVIYFVSTSPEFSFNQRSNIDFENCVLDSASEKITELSLTGGEIEPEFYYEYNGVHVPYYCYTNVAYQVCSVQRPLIKQLVERELTNSLKPVVDACYASSIEELQDLGYNVKSGNVDLNISIIPGRVTLDIFAPTTVEGQRFTTYKMALDSELYNVVLVATSIVQYETAFGDAPTTELMYYYPNLIVDKVRRGDATKVYVITDKSTEDKFQFASKSLVFPAGYDAR